MATSRHRQWLPSIAPTVNEQRGITSGGMVACMALVLLSVFSFCAVFVLSARNISLRQNNRQFHRALLEAAKESPELLSQLEHDLPDVLKAVGSHGGEPNEIVSKLRTKIGGLDNVVVEEANAKPRVTITKKISVGNASAIAKARYHSPILFYLARSLARGWENDLRSSPENLNLDYTTSGLNVRVNSSVDGTHLAATIAVEQLGTGFSYNITI